MKSHPYRIFTDYYYKWRMLPSRFTLHTHPRYEILYFHSGSCSYVLGDRVIPLQPGDLIIMNGMTQHCPKVDRSSEYVRTMFSFDPCLVEIFGPALLKCSPLQPFETLRNHHIRLNPDAQADLENILERIDRFYRLNDIVPHHRLLMAFYDLLMFVYEQCRAEIGGRPRYKSDRERYAQQIIDFVESAYMTDLDLDRIADELHISRYHLMKVFRDSTGMTIFDYIYKRRVNQAKILFFQSDELTVTDVCFKVGFKHLSHFSRVFKRQVGVSPDQFRKSVQGVHFVSNG
ncbi:AraC family transcriptional regulator [Paenibacillus allorhizosphaerae]|nr:AraC family transcriptional regulator [Paenibacillus allorhizosphaerae]